MRFRIHLLRSGIVGSLLAAFIPAAQAQYQLGMLVTGMAEDPRFAPEFALTPEQKAAAQEATRKAREAIDAGSREAKELPAAERGKALAASRKKAAARYEADLRAVLRPEQMTRLREISLQSFGGMALNSEEVQDALHMTPGQRTQAAEIVRDTALKSREIQEAARGPARTQLIKAVRRELLERELANLTEEQRAAWKAMLGLPCPLISP